MKKYLFCLAVSLCITAPVFAAAKINYLNINESILTFSTHQAKPTVKPNCVVATSEHLWAVSLNTQHGKNLYAMLLTAIASDLNIMIETTGDCNAVFGIERPKAITFSA